ncbi:MAG: hypothetical protein IJA26_00960 [Clostridia bacterium]|nr:hypothetical protein [Clostridia bacterium]
MRNREYRIGPGAVSLLLVIVVVSMSVLGLLALISARGDYKLTERVRMFACAENEASAMAEETLAGIDAVLAECAAEALDDDDYLSRISESLWENEALYMEDSIISWEEQAEGGRTLYCEIEVSPLGSAQRFSWTAHMFMAAEDEFSEW